MQRSNVLALNLPAVACSRKEVWHLRRLMKEVCFLVRLGLLLLAFAFVTPSKAATSGQYTAYEIITKAVERTRNTHFQDEAYAFTKTTVREERNSQGELRERKQECDRVLFQNGAYFKCDDNGRKASVKNSDDDLSGLDSGKSNRRKDYLDLLTPEVVGKYFFSVVSRTNANGRSVYEIAFRPRAREMPAADLKEKIMNRASGTLWIDDSEFELVRARIQVDSEIPVGGFLGALKRAAFSLERVRLESGAWFERFYKTDYEARKLAQVKRVTTQSEFGNFEKLNDG